MSRRSWSVIKYACSETYTILGVIGGFLTVICIVDFSSLVRELWLRVLCVILIFIVAFFVAILKTVFTNKVYVDLENGRRAVIEFGNLFDGEDQIVVPVNDSFDTVADDIVIARNSVHGQFITEYFAGNGNGLEQQIERELRNVAPVGVYGSDKDGKKEYYPLGTTVAVQVSGKTFYLLALTHFRGNTVEYDLSGYYTAVFSLLAHLNAHAAGHPVFMPLLGGGLARLGRTKEHELENLISVLRMSNIPIVGEVHIRLSSALKDEINLHRFC